MNRFREKSFWLEGDAYEPGPSVAGSRRVDVAIVGGGFTGTSSAYFLKRARPDWKVAVLEADAIGYGASGRNGGFVMPLIGWNMPDVYKRLGHERTQRAYRFMYQAVDHVEQMVREHQMACDHERTGYLMLAMNEARLPHLEEEAKLAAKLGYDYDFLDRQGVAEHIRSDAFLGGFFDPRCAIMNPARYVREMRRVITGLGVEVFENTPVQRIEEGRSITLHTAGGAVVADRVVLATNAYSGQLGYFKNRVMPVYTYIVLTEPLTDAQLREIGWQRRTSLETARNLIHYFRLTADDRIAFGGEDVDYHFGGQIPDVEGSPEIFARLRARVSAFFPSLANVRFTHAWGGPIAFTLDFFPTVGVMGAHRNLFYGLGYCGHGVSIANYVGAVIADLALEKQTELTELFFINRKPFPMPPEPARWPMAQGYRRALQAQDWWHARSAPASGRSLSRPKTGLKEA